MKTACYCTSIRLATRHVTALYDANLTPAGINVAQFSLIRRLDIEAPRTIGELGEALDLERSTVARNLRVLEKLDLVQMTASPTDRRAAAVTLTSKGVATREQAVTLWEDAQREFEAQVGPETAVHLRALLLTI
jgi:DNA-binding MarR family transcriptional regulator